MSYSTNKSLPTLPTYGKIEDPPIPQKLLKILDINNQKKQTTSTPNQINTPNIKYFGSWWSFFWRLLVIIVIDLHILTVGFGIAFGTTWLEKDHTISIMYSMIAIVFALDMMIGLLRKLFIQITSSQNYSKLSIILKEIKTFEFILDFTILVLVITYSSYPENTIIYLQSLCILKLKKKDRYKKYIYLKLSPYSSLTTIFFAFMLIMDSLLVTHYLAIFYILLDQQLRLHGIYTQDSQFWMSNSDAYDADISKGVWYIKYLYAQFFSLGTWTLIAPGPTPKNPIEVAYTNFSMVFYIIYASKVVDGIVDLAGYAQEIKRQNDNNIETVSNLMRSKGVNDKIKSRVENHFKYMDLVTKKQEDIKKEIHTLPLKIQAQIGEQYWNVSEMKWLGYLRKDKLMKKIMDIMKQKRIQYGEYLVNQDQDTDKILMKCPKQSVLYSCLYGSHKQYAIQIRSNNFQFLFQYQFITQLPYMFDVMALDNCEVSVVQRLQFLETIKNDGELYQKFCWVKESVLNENKSLGLDRCLFCNGEHLFKKCKQIYFGQLVRQQYFEIENNRMMFVRRNKRDQKLIGIKSLQKKRFEKGFRRIQSMKGQEDVDIDSERSFKNYYPQHNLKG